jgi:hypothetical protein
MQLSAANLLVAAQQIARQVQQPQPNAKAFTAALASETSKDDLFAPLDFKQTASTPAPSQQPPSPATSQRLGANVDIRI